MKIKKFYYLFCLFFISVSFSACYNGKLCWVDNSVTQTSNIDVQFLNVTSKAFVYGKDSENRISKYGAIGEISEINIKISGATTLDNLKNSTTAVDENGVIVKNVDDASYFTDWVKIKIRLPKGYAKINTLNGRGSVDIDKAKYVEDGYYKFNLEWVRLNKNKTGAILATDEMENDKYLFFEFLDSVDNVLSHYFLHIVYDVTIS